MVFKHIRNFYRVITEPFYRMKHGYSRSDLYDLDVTYSKYFVDTLTAFSKNLHSYPSRYENAEAWQERLQKISDCFNFYYKVDIDKDNLDEVKEKIHQGLTMLEEDWFDLWD